MIRLARPLIDEDDIQAVSSVLRSGNLIQGEHVREFEHEVARLAGSTHAVAVTNCTAALEVALRCLGIGHGDEVAVASYSWVSTANVIELVGATPVFVDVDVATHNMAPDALERVLDTHPGVRVVLPVHAFGNVTGVDRLTDICVARGIPLVEDAACALGAVQNGRPAGSWGSIGCFSFHPRKAVTTGEGGVITTSDVRIADLARSLRNHGLDPNAAQPDFVMAASNLRMTEFQAALGTTQLRKLDRILAVRRDVALGYERLLSGRGFALPQRGDAHCLQSYVVLVPPGAPPAVEVVAAMRSGGVEVSVGTWHLPLTTHFRSRYGYQPGDFPGTDELFARTVSLPIHHELTSDDLAKVVETLQHAIDPTT